MSKDADKYSFFPDPNEASGLRSANLEELTALFMRQPELSARISHELLTTEREEVLKGVLKAFLEESPVNIVFFLDDIVLSAGMMIAMFNVSEEDTKNFVTKTLDIMNEVAPNIIFNRDHLFSRIDSSVTKYRKSN